jgi:hypothetical protein
LRETVNICSPKLSSVDAGMSVTILSKIKM